MYAMSVTLDVFHPETSWLKLVAPWNMYAMSVTLDVFHPETSPLKEAAPWNMDDMSVTLDRSGTSAATYVMLVAPLNADAMDVHDMLPHCIMRVSFWALG